jgi:hypothetical protein
LQAHFLTTFEQQDVVSDCCLSAFVIFVIHSHFLITKQIDEETEKKLRYFYTWQHSTYLTSLFEFVCIGLFLGKSSPSPSRPLNVCVKTKCTFSFRCSLTVYNNNNNLSCSLFVRILRQVFLCVVAILVADFIRWML